MSHYVIIRRKILTSMLLVPLIPLILVVVIGFHYFRTSMYQKTLTKMRRIAQDHRHMIDSFLQERKADLQYILDSYDYEYITKPEAIKIILRNLQKSSGAFVDLGIFDENGVHVAYEGPHKLLGKAYKDTSWFKNVIKKGFYISDVFLGYRKIPHFIIAIAKKNHKETWVVRATIDTHLFNEMVENVRIGRTGEAYILNTKSMFQTDQRSGGRLMDKDPDAAKYHKPHEGIKTFVAEDFRGEPYLYATAWLKDKTWLLVVRQSKADAFKALRSASYLIIAIVALGGFTLIGLALYVTDRIVRHMEQLDAEKGQLSNQLIIAGRMAELGEMAAGFAHEVNNPLQIIRAEQRLIETLISELSELGELGEPKELEEMRDSAHQIGVQVDRCAKVTSGILNFARQEEPDSSPCDISAIIPEVVGLVRQRATVSGINIRQETTGDIPTIRADAGQLYQVLLNLLNNAIDAIVARHGSEGGSLEVVSRVATNGMVEISVADNGCGISPENQGKVFTPFFTTKPVGKGTGLGLSICFGIIENMGGSIAIDSEEGRGAVFSIRLPVKGRPGKYPR